jgi:hypothetical protein
MFLAPPARAGVVSFVINFRQNKSPSAIALGDSFLLRIYFLSSKASPNDSGIVIIVIIIGEAKSVLHIGGIIAQTVCLARVCLQRSEMFVHRNCLTKV